MVLVNDADEVIGTGEKIQVHKSGLLHRAFSIFIFNKNGETLLQKRIIEKYHSGGLWTNTCCGHAQPAVALQVSAERRLLEEVGLSVALQEKFAFQYYVDFSNGLYEHEIDHVFVGYSDVDPVLNPLEADAAKWMSLEVLQKEIQEKPEQFTFWCRKIIEDYYDALATYRNGPNTHR